jgi:hypothetical protein
MRLILDGTVLRVRLDRKAHFDLAAGSFAGRYACTLSHCDHTWSIDATGRASLNDGRSCYEPNLKEGVTHDAHSNHRPRRHER